LSNLSAKRLGTRQREPIWRPDRRSARRPIVSAFASPIGSLGVAGADEETVGIAVQHLIARAFEPLLRPEQDFASMPVIELASAGL